LWTISNGASTTRRYVPLEQLALSPQCGFSSTVLGNNITVDAEIAKLSLVVRVAREVWG
jgi:methionine synthase II (cobalamin-independent)